MTGVDRTVPTNSSPHHTHTPSPNPPPITDELSRWMSESQWAAVDGLIASGVPGFGALAKVRGRRLADCCKAPPVNRVQATYPRP